MRKILLILLFTLCALQNGRAEGVPYFKGTVYEALSAAQKQRKLLLVEFYASWNYRSRWTNENILPNADVLKAINQSFVIVKVDTRSKDGSVLAQQYQVKDYPSFVVFNSNGVVVDKIEESLNKQDFIARLGHIVIENDGKSGLELYRIFAAAEKGDKASTDRFAKQYIDRIGLEKAVSPANWDLFSNHDISFYGSHAFQYMVANRTEFDEVFGKQQVEEVLKKSLFEYILPYAIGMTEFDSVAVNDYRMNVAEINPIYSEALIQMSNLAILRNSKDIECYINTVRELALNIDDNYTSRIVKSLDFVAKHGTIEQKREARHLVEKYGRNTNSAAEMVIISALIEKLSE